MAKDWAKPFYNSRAWRKLREIILHRDGYSCHDCTCRATEVHHIVELTPENMNDVSISMNPDNLMSLCSDCHKKRTQGSSDVQDGYVFDADGNLVSDGEYTPQ